MADITIPAVVGQLKNQVLLDADYFIQKTGSDAVSLIDPIVLKQGIKFPATQNPSADVNTLDDYAEGLADNSWIPILSFGDNSVGISYVVQKGNYIKIGSVVIISGGIFLSSKGTSVGLAKINGLPFLLQNNLVAVPFTYRFSDIVTTGLFEIWAGYNSTNLLIGQTSGAGVRTSLTDAEFTDTTSIIFSGMYFV